MADSLKPAVLDVQDDVLLKLWEMGASADARAGFAGGYDGMIDVPKARRGGFGGGFRRGGGGFGAGGASGGW